MFKLKLDFSCSAGAAPMGKDLQFEASQKLGVSIVQTWGLSETTGSATLGDYSVEDLTGSTGALLPQMEARYDGQCLARLCVILLPGLWTTTAGIAHQTYLARF